MTRTVASLLALTAALALHLYGVRPHLARGGQDFDALHMYLPLARAFLEAGPAFLLTEAAMQAPPLSYLYPAALGARLETVMYANVVLSCVLLLLVYRTATLWHSHRAGIIAAFAFAASPLLKPFLPTALTEPPYVFLVATWIWALSEWRVRGRSAFLPVAGIALGLALLTRAPLFYGLVLLLPFLWRSRPAFAWHLVALAFPLAFIAKAYLVFGFPFYATGASNALYLGTAPWFRGYDPGYLGLVFDVGAITKTNTHLTLQSEVLLRAAARTLLAGIDARDLAAIYAQKLFAFLFVTNAETVGDVFVLRAWRIATLILATIGIAGMRDRWLRRLVAGVIVYQVAVHVPALYNHRYSVGALDVWLATLAGVGVAHLWERRRALEIAGTAALTGAGIAIGGYLAWHGGLPEPDVLAGEHVLVWERRDATVRFAQGEAVLELEVANAPAFAPWFNHVLLVDSTLTRGPGDAACGPARLTYRRNDQDAPSAPLERRFVADGRRRVHQVGAEVPLRLGAEGRLSIAMACAPGSTWEIHRIAVYSARGAAALHARIVSSARLAPR